MSDIKFYTILSNVAVKFNLTKISAQLNNPRLCIIVIRNNRLAITAHLNLPRPKRAAHLSNQPYVDNREYWISQEIIFWDFNEFENLLQGLQTLKSNSNLANVSNVIKYPAVKKFSILQRSIHLQFFYINL